ncbi:MAG: dienelactone hydrolase family protein [Gammaproteobacteria bacterium]
MSFKHDAVVVEAKSTHTASIIWLHGLGADGYDFEPIVPELGLAANAGIRFVFPNAPMMPVTINGGMTMRAWYDVRSANLREFEDEKTIVNSSILVEQYITHEIENGINADRIILAGFSQGGAIALHCGLRFEQSLAGIMALSTYLPLPQKLEDEASAANKATPIFMGHGLYDPVITVDQGRDSSRALEAAGYNVEFNEYTMEHAVCLEEIKAIGAWIKQRLT